MRQRQADHVSHRDIHQQPHEDERPDELVLHLLFIVPHGRGGLNRFARYALCIRRAVARLDDRGDDGIRIGRALIVLHLHGVGQQAHRDALHPRHLAHSLLYMR